MSYRTPPVCGCSPAPRGGRSRGFSLIEILIALLILSAGLLAIVALQTTLVSNSLISKQRSEATLLGQRKIEQIRGFQSLAEWDAYSTAGTTVQTEEVTGTWAESTVYTITTTFTNSNSVTEGRYLDVSVVVTWKDVKDASQTVRLMTAVARVDPAITPLPPANSSNSTVTCVGNAAQSWTVGGVTCSGTIGAGASTGGIATVSASSNTGINQYVCNANGIWSAVQSFTPTCAAACASTGVSWTGANGETCTANLNSGLTTDSAVSVSDNASPVTGSATYLCASNGGSASWTLQSSPAKTCTATCAAQDVTWGTTPICSGILPQGTAVNSTTVNYDVTGVSGSATYQCTNAGSWSLTSSSCIVPATTSCAATTGSWNQTVNGVNYACSAPLPQINVGQSATVNTNAASRQGSATFTCNSNGTTASYGTAANATCNTTDCAATSRTWTNNGFTCSGSLSIGTSGNTGTASNTTANFTGSATYACSNGSWAASPNSSQCVQNFCSATTKTWTVGNNTCSGSVSQTNNGVNSASVTNAAVGLTGSAVFPCADGVFGNANSGATCNAVVPTLTIATYNGCTANPANTSPCNTITKNVNVLTLSFTSTNATSATATVGGDATNPPTVSFANNSGTVTVTYNNGNRKDFSVTITVTGPGGNATRTIYLRTVNN